MATSLENFNNMTCDHIYELVATQLGVNKTQVTRHTDLRNELGADALDIAEILFALRRMQPSQSTFSKFQGMMTIKEIRTLDHLLSIQISI